MQFHHGYGGYETFNLTAMDSGKPTKWSVMSTGIEETVALELFSPSKGAHLLTAIGDYGGFVHRDLDKPAPEGSSAPPRFGNTPAWPAPKTVRTRSSASAEPPAIAAAQHRLLNGWGQHVAAHSGGAAQCSMGSIAVSTDGEIWVWTPERGAVYFTRDIGGRWTKSEGIPENTRVIADPVNPRKFYGLALFDGQLFVSTDGAANFTAQPLTLPDGLPTRGGDRGDNRGGQDRIYATPGKEGDLWLAAFNGLYHSTDGGVTFSRLGHVGQIHAFGFGKAAPALLTRPCISSGGGWTAWHFPFHQRRKSWVRINDDHHQWGLLLQITGDPKQFGRVYVGSHGRERFTATRRQRRPAEPRQEITG